MATRTQPQTPRTPDPARSVRERLLAAAEELFYTEGIASTGVDAVIERAGVATGSLYKNFGGKDALVEAYLHDRDHRWRAHWEACIAEHSDPVERVLALFTAAASWSPTSPATRGCAHLAASVQLPAGHPAIKATTAHKQYLAGRLRELCAATTTEAPDNLGQDLLLIYEGMNNLTALDLDPDPVARARHLAQQRLDNLHVRPPADPPTHVPQGEPPSATLTDESVTVE